MVAINTSYYLELAEKYFGKHRRGERSMDEWRTSMVSISEHDLEWLADGLKYACLQIREQHEYRKKLQNLLENSDSIEAMEYALQLHYKCIVLPVIEYCQAFNDWMATCQEAHTRYDEIMATEPEYAPGKPPLYDIKDYLWKLRFLDIGKSDYLRRRIYAREPHRLEPCPLHKGHWSGLRFSQEPQEGCLCQDYDGNVSGWILPKNEDVK